MVMMQMLRNNFQVKSDTNVSSTTDKSANTDIKTEKFGTVFDKVVAQQNKPIEKLENESSEQLVKVLESNSLIEFFDALDIPLDESALTVNVDGEEVAIDQLLTTENLAKLLDIDVEELQSMLQKLTNDQVDGTDIWLIIEQAPQILAKLFDTLDTPIVSEETSKLSQLLKLAQLVGEKTDTMYQQQYALKELKQALETAVVQISNVLVQVQPKPVNPLLTNAIQKPTIPLVQTEQKVEMPTQTAQNTESNLFQQNAQSNATARTVTVTLPANPASQAEALAKEIQNLLNRSQVSNNQGTMKLMLKLFPENLGQIRIEIVQQNGVMTARLLASTAAGKELLDSNLNQLKATFVSQNIQMERIDVAQALQESDKNTRDQSFFNNFFKQQSEEEKNKDNEVEEDKIEFSDLLNEEVQQ